LKSPFNSLFAKEGKLLFPAFPKRGNEKGGDLNQDMERFLLK